MQKPTRTILNVILIIALQKRRLISICLLLFFHVLWVEETTMGQSQDTQNAGVDRSQPMTTTGFLLLTAQELEYLPDLAIQGDSEAARKLYLHFFDGINDPVKGEYWFPIGAENGDALCQRAAANRLSYNDERDARAVFWLKKAANNGDEVSAQELTRLGISDSAPAPDDTMFGDTIEGRWISRETNCTW